MKRRVLALVMVAVALWPSPGRASAPVVPGYRLQFPRDEGSHPAFRTEWWYITGWLQGEDGQPLGFQVTFFRSRTSDRDDNPSRFAPRQVLLAHAALSDPRRGRLVTAQLAAREGFGLAGAAEGRTEVWMDDWSLRRADGGLRAEIPAPEFHLSLTLKPTQAPLLQGERGFSRKGPDAASASYYYSLPRVDVGGSVARDGKTLAVTGTAWLDHEWSSNYLEPEAAGWDWTGLQMRDGGALMLFRMRDRQGGTRWAGGSYRAPDGAVITFKPGDIRFTPLRRWRSPRTGTTYPVSWRIEAGTLKVELAPLMDDQENDARATTGTIYWEGAVRALADGREVGRGYLELTGYGHALRF